MSNLFQNYREKQSNCYRKGNTMSIIFHKLPESWRKCVASDGNYLKKKHSVHFKYFSLFGRSNDTSIMSRQISWIHRIANRHRLDSLLYTISFWHTSRPGPAHQRCLLYTPVTREPFGRPTSSMWMSDTRSPTSLALPNGFRSQNRRHRRQQRSGVVRV